MVKKCKNEQKKCKLFGFALGFCGVATKLSCVNGLVFPVVREVVFIELSELDAGGDVLVDQVRLFLVGTFPEIEIPVLFFMQLSTGRGFGFGGEEDGLQFVFTRLQRDIPFNLEERSVSLMLVELRNLSRRREGLGLGLIRRRFS